MNNNGLLLVVSGPTGAGKDIIIKALLEKHSEICTQVSCTTRPIREGEVDGKVYKFLNNQEFFKKVDQGVFLEWAEVYSNYYGTPKHEVLKKLKAGKNVLLELDPKGAYQVKENYPEAVLIFILPKSVEELKRNILESKKDTPENLLRKFNSAYNGIQSICKYNYGIINNSVEEAISKIENILVAEECRVERVRPISEI